MANLNTIGGLHYEMMRRCYNEKSVAYNDYGAKGIRVCEEWGRKGGFLDFKKWANEAGWIKGKTTLDRIDNDKGYSPENCRWASRIEQAINKRNVILYDYDGEDIPLSEIAKKENINYGLLYSRVKQKGMSVFDAIEDIKSGS